jgi:hypothetical protein
VKLACDLLIRYSPNANECLKEKKMKSWEVTAITNFILSCEAFLAGGFLLARAPSAPSAGYFWALAILALAAGTLVGGIDHGFFEQKGDTKSRMVMQKATWILTGIMTFLALLTVLYQFANGALRLVFVCVGLVQLVLFAFLAVRIHNFLIVIINYAPVLIALLVLNLIGIGNGTGSWYMVAGVLVSFLAGALQALAVDTFTPVDRNGIYHVVMMAAVALFFLSGLSVKG